MYVIESKETKPITILLMSSKVKFNDRTRYKLMPGEVKEIADDQYCKELLHLEKKKKITLHYFEDQKQVAIEDTDKVKPIKRVKKVESDTPSVEDKQLSVFADKEIGG